MSNKLLLEPPEPFSRLLALLHQDVALHHSDMEAWVDDSLPSDRDERTVLKAYLEKVLGERFSNAELKGLIRRTDADWIASAKGARYILEVIQRRL